MSRVDASDDVNVAANEAPSIGRCSTPAIVSGIVTPTAAKSVGITSIAWTNWWRVSPATPSPAGQWTISGSVTPPSWVSRFQRLSGVFPAQAQPHG